MPISPVLPELFARDALGCSSTLASERSTMFSSFRLRSNKTKETTGLNERHDASIKSPSKRNVLSIKSFRVFSKRLLLGNGRSGGTSDDNTPKSPTTAKRQCAKKKERIFRLPSSKASTRNGKTIAISMGELEIPEFVLCDGVNYENQHVDDESNDDDDDDESLDDDDSFDENADYDFDESTFNSHRSILDDLSMEFYEDPYIEFLKSHASFRTEGCDEDDEDEIDIHTPLPSHVVHNVPNGSHFNGLRLSLEVFEPKLEPCCSILSDDRIEAVTCSHKLGDDPEHSEESMGIPRRPTMNKAADEVNCDSSLQDIHVVFPDPAGPDTSMDLTSGFMISQSSALYSITEVVDLENIINPFANDSSHYFSQAAKDAVRERVVIEPLPLDEIIPCISSSSFTSDTQPLSHSEESSPLSQQTKKETSPIEPKASLQENLLHAKSKHPSSPTKAQFFFL